MQLRAFLLHHSLCNPCHCSKRPPSYRDCVKKTLCPNHRKCTKLFMVYCTKYSNYKNRQAMNSLVCHYNCTFKQSEGDSSTEEHYHGITNQHIIFILFICLDPPYSNSSLQCSHPRSSLYLIFATIMPKVHAL